MSDQDATLNKDTPPQNSSLDDLLAGIKREDGTQKYATPEDALKSLPHAMEHIKRLEEENKALKEGRDKTAVEKLLEQVNVKQAPPAATPPAQGLTPEDVK